MTHTANHHHERLKSQRLPAALRDALLWIKHRVNRTLASSASIQGVIQTTMRKLKQLTTKESTSIRPSPPPKETTHCTSQ